MRNSGICRRVAAFLCPATVIGALWGGAVAQTSSTYELGIDVPATLGGVDFTPEDIVLRNGASYSLESALPSGTAIGALHRLVDGRWLFSPVSPITLQGNTYEPRDVISFDGTTFAIYLQGNAVGIPAGSRVDALFVDALSNSILSFDSWVTLGGTDYGPSELIKYSGVFSLYWSGTAVGVPDYANIVGAATDSAGALVVTFDVPSSVGGTDYLPGQLVKWTGSNFESYSVDPLWPVSTQLRDFAFLASTCANTACAGECWADGTVPNPGTVAIKKAFAPAGCGPHEPGCQTQLCD